MVVGEFTQECDLVIVGGGPGGYSCAFRAAELGLSATLVDDRDALGGVCLHSGCIPSKTLLHMVEALRLAQRARQFGIAFGEPKIDLDAVRAWMTQSIDTLSNGLASLAKKHQIEIIHGRARFDDSKNITVANGSIHRLKARRSVIATGSRPIEHDHLRFAPNVLRPGEALAIERVPKSLLVLGHGYQAVEIACIYAALGAEVTLAAEDDALLPGADADLVRPLQRMLDAELAEVVMGVHIDSADAGRSHVEIKWSGEGAPKRMKFDLAIVALGQQANLEGLQLERTKVQRGEDGFIRVDETTKTNDPFIHAVGDVTGGDCLADIALHQGRICAEVLAGWQSAVDVAAMPRVVFTDPQLAWCGLTEAQAQREGRAIEVRRIPWGASGRAVGMARARDGVTKLILDPDTKLILGVGICGPQAAEMIAEGVLAIEMGATAEDLAATIHPHPTTCELLSDAAREQSKSRPSEVVEKSK